MLVVENIQHEAKSVVQQAVAELLSMNCQLELIIVDNCSQDDTFSAFEEELAGQGELAYSLVGLDHPLAKDQAIWVGVESSLGDLVVTLEPDRSSFAAAKAALDLFDEKGLAVALQNSKRPRASLGYKFALSILRVSARMSGGHSVFAQKSSAYLITREMVERVRQTGNPHLRMRQLLDDRRRLIHRAEYFATPMISRRRTLLRSIKDNARYIMWRTPLLLRGITGLGLASAFLNFIYVVLVVSAKVAGFGFSEGWASLTIQQAFYFMLMSAALSLFSEVLINVQETLIPRRYVEFHSTAEATRLSLTGRRNILGDWSDSNSR